MSNGSERIEVSRIATDAEPNSPVEIPPPLVFSQKEVEQVGAQAQSRLRLVDGFVSGRAAAAAGRAPAHARIKSTSSENRSLLTEVEDIAEKLLGLPKLKEKLAELQKQRTAQSARSAELEGLRKRLEELTPLATAANVRASSIERSAQKLSEWTDELEWVAERRPLWPASADYLQRRAGPCSACLDARPGHPPCASR